MSIIFYDHLVDKTEIHIHLERLGVEESKKNRLKELAEDILHSGLVEFILKKLDRKKHASFLSRLEHAPYDPELIGYLRDYIDREIEDQIRRESARLIRLILKDLS